MDKGLCACGCGTPAGGTWVRGHNPKSIARPAAERFWEKVELGPGCWVWLGASDRLGYGRFRVSTKAVVVAAHRFAFEQLVGPIPPGLELDHLCRRPSCVRPEHLEPVDHRTNVLRGGAPPAVNARKVVCHRGHELDHRSNGWRECRTCASDRAAGRIPNNLIHPTKGQRQ